MRDWKKSFFLVLVALLLISLAAPEPAPACTLIVASGKATHNGRPLMWKNHDTPQLLNKLMYFKDARYKFIGLINADDAEGKEIWAGLNERGLAIMNSQADDLALKEKKYDGSGNGAFMRLALGQCATVDEFEKLLQKEKGKWDLAANFGVMDASGGAAFFETSSDYYTRFDADDIKVAPFGYIVRTNFSYTSPDYLQGGGFIRFERMSHLAEMARATGQLEVKFILQQAARDLNHEKLHSYPLSRPLPDDPARPLYINTNDTINRNSTASVVVFEGAPSSDRPDLATMWVILGQPISGVAIPVWPYAERVPVAASAPGQETCPLNIFSRKLVSYLYPDRRGRMPQYLDVTRLRTYGGEGALTKLLRIENQVLEKTRLQLKTWEKKKETPVRVSEFQESSADLVWQSLLSEFPDIR
ncbi:MAG: carcinine hydrolase/isopenicillin-N N-acyltransferase family protein [Candidatus Saccharicenans sp.]|uniref:carcinine hydrolase/isopenicillin-N N-acyltransferase family protein n=1 Tax=Candidatus Saccharicenans sp. TaxID=2819258 RepID=UPI00404995F9